VTTFTPRERVYIKASLKSMFCVNLFLSTILQGEMGSKVVSWLEKSLGDARIRKERLLQGKEPALLMDNLPDDIRYHKEHMWAREDGTMGLSFYAQDQLGEIVFIEVPDAGAEIRAGEVFGTIESMKSVSQLYAPVTGVIKEVNTAVSEAPELINEAPYGEGWIARVEFSDAGELATLLSAREYNDLVCGMEVLS
jgi:glycine cleavage system H protein